MILLIGGSSYAQSGWFWQNPLPQGNTLYDVEFIGNGIAIACGDAGTILRTTNSGATWNVINNDSGVVSKSVDFFNSNTGWIISTYNGAAKVKKTIDGGFSWNEMAIIGGADAYNIEFVSLDTGYASVRGSTGSYVFKTTNSGSNWNSVFYNSGSYSYSTCFLNNSTGFVCGTFGITKTTNGGINWVYKYGSPEPPSPQYTTKNMHFFDANTGIAVGQYSVYPSPSFGRTLKTTNSGENWVVVFNGINNSGFEDLDFVNNTTGFVCGSGISKSTNIGSNWLSIIQSPGFYLRSIDLLLPNGLSVGELGILLKTTNSGENWINNFSSYRTYNDIANISFYNKEIGFAALGRIIFRTTNGGNNWNTDSIPYHVVSFSIVDSNNIYAGGYSLVKTTNLGINWTLVNASTSITSINFPDNNTGFSCSGTYVAKTTNGGINWVSTNLNTGVLSSIYFTNNTTGYVVGYSNAHKTTNGGGNWSLIPVKGNCVYFLNADTGYVCGINDEIRKTTNGGLSWVTQKSATSSGGSLRSIHFINSLTGIAAGSSIVRTTNGGVNWYYQKKPTNYYLRSVFMTDTNEAYIAGDNATIIKSTNGGITLGVNNISYIIPKTFLLHQNYPNPFNPQTKIKFEIPAVVKSQRSNVKLIIYDLLGREVAILVNEDLRHGTYEADWDASSFSSGVYFYRIISGEFVETKKMVLMK